MLQTHLLSLLSASLPKVKYAFTMMRSTKYSTFIVSVEFRVMILLVRQYRLHWYWFTILQIALVLLTLQPCKIIRHQEI